MTAKIDQAWEILKGEGLQALGRELQRFFQRRIMAAMAWSRGAFQIQVESRVARFEIRSYGEALNWIRTYQTEEICLRHLIGRLRSADVFWDIGAYHGLYAILAAQFCRKVIAFEPYSQNARRIIMNTRLNGCQDRVRVLRIALSDREGPGFFDWSYAVESSKGGTEWPHPPFSPLPTALRAVGRGEKNPFWGRSGAPSAPRSAPKAPRETNCVSPISI